MSVTSDSIRLEAFTGIWKNCLSPEAILPDSSESKESNSIPVTQGLVNICLLYLHNGNSNLSNRTKQ